MNYIEYRKYYCIVRQTCLCGGRDELYRIQETLLCRETNMSLDGTVETIVTTHK